MPNSVWFPRHYGNRVYRVNYDRDAGKSNPEYFCFPALEQLIFFAGLEIDYVVIHRCRLLFIGTLRCRLLFISDHFAAQLWRPVFGVHRYAAGDSMTVLAWFATSINWTLPDVQDLPCGFPARR